VFAFNDDVLNVLSSDMIKVFAEDLKVYNVTEYRSNCESVKNHLTASYFSSEWLFYRC